MYRWIIALFFLLPAQAAVLDVTALNVVNVAGTAPSGAWRKITLPAATRCVQIALDGAGWVDGTAAGYADAAARSSGGWPVTSSTIITWPVDASSERLSIYAAGNGGARAITLQAFRSGCSS